MLRTRPTGKFNPVSVALVAAIAGGIYWLAMFAGVYLDNVDVSEAVVAAYNQVGMHYSEEKVRVELKEKLKRIGTHRELNEEGDLVEVGGLGVQDEDIIFDRDPESGILTIQVTYVREVRLKPSAKWRTVRFSPKKVGPAVRK